MEISNSPYSPICLFTYKRLSETMRVVDALRANTLAPFSDLYVFCDGWKGANDYEDVMAVRTYLENITGFRSIVLEFSDVNKGLSRSIIDGVTAVMSKYGRAVVVEDDVVTSKNFLSFMNQALDFYRDFSRIWSISGFAYDFEPSESATYDVYFGVRASSWGWATWENRWVKVDWGLEGYADFIKDKKARSRFNLGGSDMCKMLRDQHAGRVDTWDIRFCFSQFVNNGLDVFPRVSKVKNIGFGDSATHTAGMQRRFATTLDTSGCEEFSFPEGVKLDHHILRQFRRRFSVKERLKYKLLAMLK